MKEVRESCDVSSGFINFLKKVFFFFFLLTDYFWLGPLPCILFSVINIINDSILWWPCKAIRASKNLFYSHYNFYYNYYYFFFSLIFSLPSRKIYWSLDFSKKKKRKKKTFVDVAISCCIVEKSNYSTSGRNLIRSFTSLSAVEHRQWSSSISSNCPMNLSSANSEEVRRCFRLFKLAIKPTAMRLLYNRIFSYPAYR